MAIFMVDNNLFNNIVVYKNSEKEKYFITIDFSSGYGRALVMDPYFKVYKGKSYTQAKEDVRFYLRDGHADKHDDGKKLLKVTNDLIDNVSRILQSNTTNKSFGLITVYDCIWKLIDDYAKSNNCKSLDYIPLDIFLENLYEKNYKK